jgi:hypothetical protein
MTCKVSTLWPRPLLDTFSGYPSPLPCAQSAGHSAPWPILSAMRPGWHMWIPSSVLVANREIPRPENAEPRAGRGMQRLLRSAPVDMRCSAGPGAQALAVSVGAEGLVDRKCVGGGLVPHSGHPRQSSCTRLGAIRKQEDPGRSPRPGSCHVAASRISCAPCPPSCLRKSTASCRAVSRRRLRSGGRRCCGGSP